MKNFLLVALILTIFVMLESCEKSESTGQAVSNIEIPVGALLPLSGPGYLSGLMTQAALNIARDEVNAYYQQLGLNQRIKLLVEDTKTDSATALAKLKVLAQQGAKAIIGTYSSAEAKNCLAYANQHGLLMISHASESQSLAIPGDNLFRLLPPVARQAEAMVKLMEADSIVAVFPLVRNDLWGSELYSNFETLFTAAGHFVGDPVLYPPSTTDYNAALSTLESIVAPNIIPYNPARVSIFMISFDEGEDILELAGNFTALSQVKWYGSSAFAQNSDVLLNPLAAGFAATHQGLPSPVLGLEEAARDKWERLSNQIHTTTGHTPDIFSLIAYDILWLVAKTQLVSSYSKGIETFKSSFTLQADQYFGASGRTTLDANGDRKYGNFDFWTIFQQGTNYIWYSSAVYNTATGQLIRLPHP